MRNYFRRIIFLTLAVFVLTSFSFAQDMKLPTPREENLLNGLKVLMWRQPNTGRVSVKIRVHSGSAFDPIGKEGTIALLGDILFPEPNLKKYFEEDLEGKLEVITTYDYIQINATAKSSEFLAVMETLAPVMSEPQIDKKTTAKVRIERMKMLKELEKDPGYIADRAVAERLFGDYPYGKAQKGTTSSLPRIDFADLLFAKERFLTADNATMTITGDFKLSYGYKVARRLFGGWQKSLNKVPANFRIPDKPETTPQTINIEEGDTIEDRYALLAINRKDKDYFASRILTNILDKRFAQNSKQKGLKSSTVENKTMFLRGFIVFAKSLDPNNLPELTQTAGFEIAPKIAPTVETNKIEQHFIAKLLNEKIQLNEFDTAKSLVSSMVKKRDAAEHFLNADTYRLGSVTKMLEGLGKASHQEVENLAAKLAMSKIVEVSVRSILNEETNEPKPEVDPKAQEKKLDNNPVN